MVYGVSHGRSVCFLKKQIVRKVSKGSLRQRHFGSCGGEMKVIVCNVRLRNRNQGLSITKLMLRREGWRG